MVGEWYFIAVVSILESIRERV